MKRSEEIADLINPDKSTINPKTTSRTNSNETIESQILPLNSLSIVENSSSAWQRASTTPRAIAVLHRTNSTENSQSPTNSSNLASAAIGGGSPNSTPIPILVETSGRPKSNSITSASSSLSVSNLTPNDLSI